MLLDSIIDILNESFRNAHVTDDERVDRRLIQDWILLRRNVYIKNYFNQHGRTEQNTLQFQPLDVERYDPSLAIGGISIGKYILRTELCPSIIEGNSGVAVYEMTSSDITSKTIQIVSFDRLRWCGNGLTNKHTLFSAFYDGRFYIKSNSEIEKPISKVQVVATFADPTQVTTYVRATDDYSTNDYMISYMLNEVKTQDFNFTRQMPSDQTNNSSGDIQQ